MVAAEGQSMKRTVIILAAGLGLVVLSFWLMHSRPDLTMRAHEAYQRGDFGAAMRAYQEAAPECSDLGDLAACQAAALYRLDRYEDADGRYRIAESDDDEGRTARAAYGRGNCALRQACQIEQTLDQRLLDKAAAHFSACLDWEVKTTDAGNLFADARHNLELIKLLRQRAPADGETARQGAGQNASNQGAGNASHSHSSAEQQDSARTERQAALAGLMAQKLNDDYLCPD
jgi:hypothetical protein